MCSPSATSAMEPNIKPPTISAIIIAPQSQITAQVRRSLASCVSPRKAWLWPRSMAEWERSDMLRAFT